MPGRGCAFGVLVAASVVSAVGSGLTTFALAVEAFRRTGDATSVGVMAAAGMLPMLLVAPLGGLLADRWDRRLVMVVGDGGSGLALGLVVWRLAAPDGTLLQVVAALALASLLAGMTEPAMRATVSDLVPPERLDRASGMLQIGGAARWLVAPALAGVLLTVWPTWAVVAVDMATFTCTVAAALVVRAAVGPTADPTRSTVLADLSEGLAACTTPTMARLVAVMGVAGFAIGAVQSLFSPLVLAFASTRALGLVTSLGASGMMVGSIVVGAVGVRTDLRTGLALGLGVAGLGMVALGLRASLWTVAAGALVFFGALPLANASADVLLRRSVPNALLGRVWGAVGILSQATTVLAFVTLGPLADAYATPALLPGGPLAATVGTVLGTGPGRGVALVVAASGLLLILTALAASRSHTLASPQPADEARPEVFA